MSVWIIDTNIFAYWIIGKGVPLSKWNLEKENITFKEEIIEEVYEKILEEVDYLVNNDKTNFEFLKTIEFSDRKDYINLYFSLLFFIPSVRTQDAILLTNAIFGNANYFITEDQRLVNCWKKLEKKYSLEVIKSGTAIKKLNSK